MPLSVGTRLGPYEIPAPLLVLAALLAVALAAAASAQRARREADAHIAAARTASGEAHAGPPAQQPPTAAKQVPPATPSAATGSKVWIGRYAQYEDFLRTAATDRTTATGTTRHVFFKPGGLAAGAALKRDSHKLEIAGYKLDQVLELDMVPPTVEVRSDGDMVSLQLWVENARMLKQLNEQKVRAPDPARWNHQLHRAYAFEDLVANLDPTEGSPIVDPQWNLIVLDHSRAFTTTMAQPYEIGKKLNQIDRAFFDRIKALDKATVTRAIGDLVGPRRDRRAVRTA